MKAGYAVYKATLIGAPTREVGVLIELSTETSDPIWQDGLWGQGNLDLATCEIIGAIELERLDAGELIWSALPE